jgi:hypothetical protein
MPGAILASIIWRKYSVIILGLMGLTLIVSALTYGVSEGPAAVSLLIDFGIIFLIMALMIKALRWWKRVKSVPPRPKKF